MVKTLGLTTLAFACSALLTASPTQAEGFYISIAAGTDMPSDHDFDTGAGAVGVVDTELDEGSALKFILGKQLESFRVEAEIALRMSEVEAHKLGSDTLPGSVGDAESKGYMLSALYDIGDTSKRVVPYVGAGVGVGAVQFENYTIDGVPSVLNDEDAGFAYQFMLGLTIGLTDNIKLGLEYQYFSVLDLEVQTELGANNTDIDYDTQNLFAALRYHF